MISFYGWTQVDKFFDAWRSAGFRIVGHLVFRKQYTSKARFLQYQHEQAYLLAKGNPPLPEQPIRDVSDMPYSGNKLHPTQKPIPALKPLIESFTRTGDLVLDPFCGSGSTLLAAKILKRRYLGIELDANYHAAATKRLHPDGIRANRDCIRRSSCRRQGPCRPSAVRWPLRKNSYSKVRSLDSCGAAASFPSIARMPMLARRGSEDREHWPVHITSSLDRGRSHAVSTSGIEVEQFGAKPEDLSDPRDAFQGEALPCLFFARGLEPSPECGSHRADPLMEHHLRHARAQPQSLHTGNQSAAVFTIAEILHDSPPL
jgi:hypothetical protein